MGGMGSGRSGGRPTIESCAFVLDINDLRRSGCLIPDATCKSQITWPGEDGAARLTVALDHQGVEARHVPPRLKTARPPARRRCQTRLLPSGSKASGSEVVGKPLRHSGRGSRRCALEPPRAEPHAQLAASRPQRPEKPSAAQQACGSACR